MVNRGTADLSRQRCRIHLVTTALLVGLGFPALAGCVPGDGADTGVPPAVGQSSPAMDRSAAAGTVSGGASAAPHGDGAAESVGRSGLPTIAMAALPPEARRTLALIKLGGPFPHQRDGAMFANWERMLPAKPRGYYREYTVPTPGEMRRGPRRLVAGYGGERYYTSDHYRSFREVVP